MKFESKFNFWDRPFKITKTSERIFEPCTFCKGSGKIIGADNTKRTCPECYGRAGNHKFVNKGWRVNGQVTVGEIRIRHRCKSNGHDPESIFDNYGPQEEEYEEEYMCPETGIGSGTIHKTETLWLTEEEAQWKCDRLNELIEVNE